MRTFSGNRKCPYAKICSLAATTPRMQLLAECLMSINRILAVLQPVEYARVCVLDARDSAHVIHIFSNIVRKCFIFQAHQPFARISFAVLIIIPILVAVPSFIIGYDFMILWIKRDCILAGSLLAQHMACGVQSSSFPLWKSNQLILLRLVENRTEHRRKKTIVTKISRILTNGYHLTLTLIGLICNSVMVVAIFWKKRKAVIRPMVCKWPLKKNWIFL